MLYAVLTCFALVLIAPIVHRFAGSKVTGPLLAIAPAAWFGWFVSKIPTIQEGGVALTSYAWLPQYDIFISFRLDGLSLLFALLILGIGAIVVAYSGPYMKKHGDGGRFFPYLTLFMGSMLGLVLADNMIALFVFWELTSVSSFLLIGFDHDKQESRRAAIQALLVTALGGIALFAGALLLRSATGGWSLTEVLQADGLREHAFYTPAVLLLALAAFTKSAQWPFHFWLPSAMVAPTPVSTYLHSATMVKAGVYLLARMQPALGGTDLWFYLVGVGGAITVVVASVMAITQDDMKRLLAYSTVAALGTMVLLIGLGSKYALMALPVYIAAHGLYKAPLFLVAGLYDMRTKSRNISELSGLLKTMPVTATAALVAGLSFAGLPPAAGFIAKELTYKAAVGSPFMYLVPFVLVLAKALLFAAAVRVALVPAIGPTNERTAGAKEGPLFMVLGPVLLAGFGLIAGIFGPDLFAAFTEPAAVALAGAVSPDLTLWHGATPAFWLSVVTVAAGLGLFALMSSLIRVRNRVQPVAAYGPDRWYDWALVVLDRVASWQTRVIQSGRLRNYVLTVVITVVVLGGGTFLLQHGIAVTAPTNHLTPLALVIVLITLAGALATTIVRSRLTAVATLGVAGFGVALTFLMYSGPDVSATQFAVETLGVILFVFVLYRMPKFRRQLQTGTVIRDAIIALLAGTFMTLLVLAAYVPQVPMSKLGQYFGEQSYLLGKGRNVVNVILVDFRALDTLGEITVIAIAALGVFSLMVLRRKQG